MSKPLPTVRDIDIRSEWPFIGLRWRREYRHERLIGAGGFVLASAIAFSAGLAAIGGLAAAAAGYEFNNYLSWIDIYGRP